MPIRPKKVSRPWVREYKPFEREVDFSAFYNARKWRKVSKAYREAHPLCECEGCKSSGAVKPAEVCDHIRGLKFLLDNGYDPYDWNELQSMSKECHNKKSGSEAHRGGYGVKSLRG